MMAKQADMKRPHMKQPDANGFSLIEVAIVLVIISVLVAIVAVPLATQLQVHK